MVGHLCGCFLNGALDPDVASAATVVPAHGVVNLCFCRRGGGIQEGRGVHQLAAHTPTALGRLVINKGLLERV